MTSAGGYWRVAERALALAADLEGDESLGCWAEGLRGLGRLAGRLAGQRGVRELRGDVPPAGGVRGMGTFRVGMVTSVFMPRDQVVATLIPLDESDGWIEKIEVTVDPSKSPSAELLNVNAIVRVALAQQSQGDAHWGGERPLPPPPPLGPDDGTHRFWHQGPVVVCSCRWRSDGGIGLEGTVAEHNQRQLNHMVNVLWEERELRFKQPRGHEEAAA